MIPKGDPAAFLSARLTAGCAVIDVGANRGHVARVLAEAVGPQGKVYAVEPDPRCWGDLEELRRTRPQIVLRRAAAHARSGASALILGKDPAQSSLWRDAVHEPAPEYSCDVEWLTLDEITARPVCAIKVDAQGNERHILHGASRLLRECPLWVVEVWPHGLTAAGSCAVALYDAFITADYTAHAVTPDMEPVTRHLMESMDARHVEHDHINVAFRKV